RKTYIIDWGKSDPENGNFVYAGEELLAEHKSSSNVVILNNNGYYCGVVSSGEHFEYETRYSSYNEYISPNKCKEYFWGDKYCYSRDRGDPCDANYFSREVIECPSE
ncbi:MAG: hypothetical protein J6U64_01330, partial [Alphaproteobacteria bacterium]|nr:hypothetical protein [Alphaproteobacteria bacterium]